MNKAAAAVLRVGSAAIIACVTATAALAQGDTPATAAAAPSAPDVPPAPGDIVVTARRIAERLQDVPISITVVTPEQISNRNIVSPVDLATYTPSLSTNQRYGPEKASFAIRGFTQEPLTSPSVGTYFADVVAPRSANGTTSGNGASPGALFDLQNIQVLKGPQGTLFGRNTTGGAVLLVPNKPTDKLEGYAEVTAGNYDQIRGQGVINIPLTDSIRVRAGVDRNEREGYMRNHSGVGPKDYNDVNYVAARLSVVADITPELENYTIGTYSHSFGHGYGARIVLCNTDIAGSPYSAKPIPVGTSAARILTARAACAQIARQNARGEGLLDIENSNPDPLINDRQFQVINTTTWQATDTLTFKNIISYSEFREAASFALNSDNFFYTSPPLAANSPFIGQQFYQTLLNPVPGQDNSAQSTFTEEFQLQGRAFGDSLEYQAGVYQEISKSLGFNESYTAVNLSCTNLGLLQCTNPLGVGTVSNAKQKINFNNKGFYAQADYDFTSRLTATAGIRYTIDRTVGIAEGTRRTFNLTGMTGRVCNDTLRFQGPRTPAGAPTPLSVTDSSQCHAVYVAKSDKPTWLLGLQYKPVDDVMVYGKYARGYRQGSVNLGAIGLETWGPESVDAYEIGVKSSFRGALSGYIDVAGFYNNLRDQQLVASLVGKPNSGVSGAAAIVNAGKSRIEGVEVESSFTYGAFRLDAGYTYLKTKLLSLTPPVLPADSPFLSTITFSAQVGKALPLAPKNRVTLTGTYTLPIDERLGHLSAGATFVHTDAQNATSPAASPLYRLPPTDLLNFNVDWKNVLQSPFDLSFFMTNVTNEIYPVNIGTAYNANGFEDQLIGQPRIFGFRVRYAFGR